VSVTGTLTVDLGIRHNNFLVVSLLAKGGLTAIANGFEPAWDYGTVPGTFVITIAKQDAAFGNLIADTVARNVTFVVLEGNAASLY